MAEDKFIDTNKILDEDGFELDPNTLDYDKGYLKSENILIAHHDAVPEVEEVSHFAVQTFYFTDDTQMDIISEDDPHVHMIDDKQGIVEYIDLGEGKTLRGTDLRTVVDIPHEDAVEAYDEYERIQRWIPFTPEELAEREEQRIKGEIQRRFIETGPERLDTTELNVEDLTLLMADMIGVN